MVELNASFLFTNPNDCVSAARFLLRLITGKDSGLNAFRMAANALLGVSITFLGVEVSGEFMIYCWRSLVMICH